MQTGAIEAVKQEKAVPEKGGRNYELDFFRLVFALLVFIYHTNPFIGKNTRVVLPPILERERYISFSFFQECLWQTA